MTLLSRAAKRNVCKQQELLMKSSTTWKPITPRDNLKSISRKRVAVRRNLASSAPPAIRLPPKIIIEEASLKKIDESLPVERMKSSPDIILCESAPPNAESMNIANQRWETSEWAANQPLTPRRYPMHLTRPKYHSSSKPPQTGSTRPSTTDWDWVRSKLMSRDSIRRPESSMTFEDFLNGLELDSDEYDTDLESDYYDDDAVPHDPTGVWHYQNLCKIKGVSPSHQVLQKLRGKHIQFKLNHRYIRSRDTKALTGGLQHSIYVKDLDLSDNCLNDKGAKHVANMMRNNSYIHRLDLSENCLQHDAGRYIAQMMMTNHCLTHLCLKKNKLGDKEALLLSEVLSSNESLKSLDVSHNQFGDNAGEAIAAALIDNHCLTSLNLSWNSLCKRASAAIARALDLNSTLLSLDLSWNGLGDDGAALLGNGLRDNSTLRYLSLAVNHICGHGAEQLASCVAGGITQARRQKAKLGKTRSGLQYLNLDRNPLGAGGIKMFLMRLEQAGMLKALSIREVVLNEEVLKKIHAIIRMGSRKLTLLYEGQSQEEQTNALKYFGIRTLNTALEPHMTKIESVVKTMDGYGYGVGVSDLRNALSEHTPSLTELELENALQSLDTDGDDIIHYKDVAFYHSSPT